MTNSLTIKSTVTQILTLSIYVKPTNINVIKILSAIVSKNAPIFEDTFHFLANRPSKKSVQAAIKAIIAGTNIKPSLEPSAKIRYKITGDETIRKIANKSGIYFFIKSHQLFFVQMHFLFHFLNFLKRCQ